MTQAWSMQARRPRRRRFVAGVALATLLIVGVVAGAVSLAPGAGPASAGAAGLGATPTPATAAVPASPAGSAGDGIPSIAPSNAVAVAPPPASPVDPATAAALQKALEAARKAMVIPGIEATVILADGRTWTGVAGDAVAATHAKVTPQTPFPIASVTKTFTAALILRLAEEGRLTIDDPLARWLPDYPNAVHITLRMLLTHTSGLADFFQNPKLDTALNRAKGRVWTPAEVLPFVAKPAFAPGKGWGYSNTNYVLLGLVAERAGGAPWADQVREDFFVPLGLASTYVQGVVTPNVPPAHSNQMFIGYGGKILPRDLSDGSSIAPFTAVATAAYSAGSIASTTEDLARWARALYSGAVLAPASLAEMLTFDPDITRYAALAYGLGVSRVKIDGRFVAVGHTGALAGTRASIRWLPAQRVSVAVAFNRDLFTGDDATRFLIAALYPRAKPAASPGVATPSPAPSALP